MRRIGITGHQGLDRATAVLVKNAVRDKLHALRPVIGISSLADGADQIFAETLLAEGGSLIAVVPCAGYDRSFTEEDARRRYLRLLQRCTEVIKLPFDEPSENAYWAAGQRVVELSDEMLAVWDGQLSGGLGGTADVVAFAREQNVPVTVLWPPGSSRG